MMAFDKVKKVQDSRQAGTRVSPSNLRKCDVLQAIPLYRGFLATAGRIRTIGVAFGDPAIHEVQTY
jgi:hypothetical protein